MTKRMNVEQAVRRLAAERLTVRLELSERGDVELVVYDGDDEMGRLEVIGGVLDEGAHGVASMIQHVERERINLARRTTLALVS